MTGDFFSLTRFGESAAEAFSADTKNWLYGVAWNLVLCLDDNLIFGSPVDDRRNPHLCPFSLNRFRMPHTTFRFKRPAPSHKYNQIPVPALRFFDQLANATLFQPLIDKVVSPRPRHSKSGAKFPIGFWRRQPSKWPLKFIRHLLHMLAGFFDSNCRVDTGHARHKPSRHGCMSRTKTVIASAAHRPDGSWFPHPMHKPNKGASFLEFVGVAPKRFKRFKVNICFHSPPRSFAEHPPALQKRSSRRGFI